MQGPCTWVWHNREMVNIFRTNRLLLLLHTTSDRIPKACSTNTASCWSHLGRYMISSHTTSLFVLAKVCHGFTSFLFLRKPAQLSAACSAEKWEEPGVFHMSMTWSRNDENFLEQTGFFHLSILQATEGCEKASGWDLVAYSVIQVYLVTNSVTFDLIILSLSSSKFSDIGWPHWGACPRLVDLITSWSGGNWYCEKSWELIRWRQLE